MSYRLKQRHFSHLNLLVLCQKLLWENVCLFSSWCFHQLLVRTQDEGQSESAWWWAFNRNVLVSPRMLLQAFLVSDWKFHPESRGSHVEIGKQFQKSKVGLWAVGSKSWTRGSHKTSGHLHHKSFLSSGLSFLLCFLLVWELFFWGKPWQVLFHPCVRPNSNRGNLWSLKTFKWQENGFLPSHERCHCKVRKIMKC